MAERKRKRKKLNQKDGNGKSVDYQNNFEVYFDEHGRIACAKVSGAVVKYVRLLRGASLILEEMSLEKFLEVFEKRETYPADKAALILANYAVVIGSKIEALKFLGITDDKLINESVSKFRPPTEESLTAKPRSKTVPKETNSRAVEWGGEKYTSMADMIRKMLVAGERDEEIFTAMQGAYNAPESKRSYIDYYRKQLEKSDGTKGKETRRKRIR